MPNMDDWIADQIEAAIKEQKQHKSSTKMNWKTGDKGYVTIAGQEYIFIILDWAFSSEGDYLQTKLELSRTEKDLSGVEHTQTWVHPRPIQSYRLRQKSQRLKPTEEATPPGEGLWS